MKRTNRLILVVGILLAVVAFVGVFFVLNQKGGGGDQPSVPQANVVVAKQNIKLGDTVKEGDVEQKQVNLSDRKPEYIALPGDVIGQVARTDIARGAILTTTMFAGSGQTSIAKDLPAGMRAVAVRVDAVSGVGSLILPGDRVDLVITVRMTPVTVTETEGAPPQVTKQEGLTADSSKLILQNVEVRGILGGVATTSSTDGGSTAPTDISTAQQVVLLGVTPQQAEVIGFLQQSALTAGSAQANNNITLVLRSPQDRNAADVVTTGVLLQTLIKDYGVLPPAILEASLPPTR